MGYPAALAIQVAVVGNRYKMKCRKEVAFFQSFLKTLNATGTFYAHVVRKLIQAFFICFQDLFKHRFLVS
jgi:hypothetical protein